MESSVAFGCAKTCAPLRRPPPPRSPVGFGFRSRWRVPDPQRTRIRLVATAHDKPVAPPLPEHGEEEEEEEEAAAKKDEKSIGRLVEELESLVEEAMAGKDDGREPSDYDRRARIFYQSSRVFQALKEWIGIVDGGA